MNVLLLVVLVVLSRWPLPPGVQDAAGYTPLLQPDGLSGWSADSTTQQCVTNASRILAITECAGWVRLGTRLTGTYRLAFELRARDANATATLSLTTGPTSDGRPQPTAVVPLKPAAEWQEYVVEVDKTVVVQIDGTRTPFRSFSEPPIGSIGFRAQGAIEVRNPRIMNLVPNTAAGGAVRPGNGVTLPRLLRQVRPEYTKEAKDAKIQGVVVVECVVLPDGSVGQATVTRSLDRTFGLDEEAIKAAKQWKFSPGTRNGEPVPVLVSVELTFTLR